MGLLGKNGFASAHVRERGGKCLVVQAVAGRSRGESAAEARDLWGSGSGWLGPSYPAEMSAGGPRTWSEIGFARPRSDLAGACLLRRTRLFVRGYVTGESAQAPIQNEDRYALDVSVMRESSDMQLQVTPGDTVMYLGEVENEDVPVLWAPMRVVRVDPVRAGRCHVWAIVDSLILSSHAGLDVIRRPEISAEDWEVVSSVAMSEAAATPGERRQLLGMFGLAG